MSDSNESQIAQLEAVIAALEAQRPVLGNSAVDAGIAPLREKLATLRTPPAPAAAPSEERRIVTILFSDVVGSTALAEKLDPEDWRQTIAALHRTVGDLIAKNNGRVVQYLGDGLLALFGADRPDERDAEDAIRAALEIQNSKFGIPDSGLQTANSEFRIPNFELRLRVGIHTGLVVVGEIGSATKKEFTASGDAMNLAARLQSAAPPGGVLISHDTYHYVRGIFDVTPQPPLPLKGKSEPVRAYLVRRAKPRAFQIAAHSAIGVGSKTVGREHEFQLLQEGYREGIEQQCLTWAQLVGEPGLGKSRLLEDLDDWLELREETVRLFRARASPSDANQPYALIRRLWFDRFQIAEDAPLAQAETKWVERFKELWGSAPEPEREERAHALGLLLGLAFRDSPFIGAMRDDPTQVRGRAFVVSRELLTRIRTGNPIVFLLEDLHWADIASWDYLLNVVLDSSQPTGSADKLQGLYILGTARPEWRPPEGLRAERPDFRYLEITLSSLNNAAMRELVTSLLGRVEQMPTTVIDELVARAEGVPYFAEELVNWFLDRGVIDSSKTPWRFVPERFKDSPLPATLQHLLLTRLWSLSEVERTALQRGAIFGRHFWAGGVESLGVRESRQVLTPLQPRGLVEFQPESAFQGEQEWSFHHNLLRDVTYESVLKRERAGLHRAAARWLAEQAERAGRSDEFAGLIAEHLERAGDTGEAAEWYLRAGERAQASSALAEARRFFDRALGLSTPQNNERRWRALLGREVVLKLSGERTAQGEDLDALRTLAEELHDKGRESEAAYRRVGYFASLGNYRAAASAAEQAIDAAQQAGNRALEVRAYARLAFMLARQGDREAARKTAETTLELMSTVQDHAAVAHTLFSLAVLAGESGDPSQAVQLSLDAIERARQAGDRQTEATALLNQGYYYGELGLYKLARNSLEKALRMCQALNDRRNTAYCFQNLGDIAWRIGDGRTARGLQEQALAEFNAVGDSYGRLSSLVYLGYIADQVEDYGTEGTHLAAARTELNQLGYSALSTEALAGQARCALAEGRQDEARRWAEEVWAYLREHSLEGIISPSRVFFSIADIFDALGRAAESLAVIEAGYAELMSRANKIGNLEWRRSFLENVEEHRLLVEMWERVAGRR